MKKLAPKITCDFGLPNNIGQILAYLRPLLPDGIKQIQQASVIETRYLFESIFLKMVVLLDCVTRRLLIEEYESECKLKEIAESITHRLHPRSINGILSKPRNMEPTRDSDVTNQKQVFIEICVKYILFTYSIY